MSDSKDSDRWYAIGNLEEVFSPSLVLYEDRVKGNIASALDEVGDPDRLRPHIKTHKMPGVLALQLDAGIVKFKCATIAEAEMAATAGAPDVMLACQPAGPNARRLRRLAEALPGTVFSTITDDLEVVRSLSSEFENSDREIDVLLDLDTGMHRSGMVPGPRCGELYLEIKKLPGVNPGGLHVYDGHIKEKDPARRLAQTELEFGAALELAAALKEAFLPVPRIVAGGSPTFPTHAREKIPGLECSPGTFVFWDHQYGEAYPEMPFQPAALVVTRVISKPGADRLCLDLGHKAISAENPPDRRVHLIGLPDAEVEMHSEEHLVVRTRRAEEFAVGDVIFGVPFHICPTVALYGHAVIVRDGVAAGMWDVTARDRVLRY